MGEITTMNDAFADFRLKLEAHEDQLANLLPDGVTRKVFQDAALTACTRNKDLLRCDRLGLVNAVIAAAQDGLMPDGKEGVILPQWEKEKDGDGRERSVLKARWQPMIFGIRKRALELGDIIIDAQVVHQHDVFDWEAGDEPHIHHKPNHLGDRGPMVCAYAIFRQGKEIIHREVMLMAQIMAVKSISKQPGGLMWKQFEGEAWRKTVVRRGIKSVPSITKKLCDIIKRFDDLHNVDLDEAPSALDVGAASPAIAATDPETATETKRSARDRIRGTLTTIKGGAPPKELTPDEKMLIDLNREIGEGELIEIIEQRFAGRIMSASPQAREKAVELIQGAKMGDRIAAGTA